MRPNVTVESRPTEAMVALRIFIQACPNKWSAVWLERIGSARPCTRGPCTGSAASRPAVQAAGCHLGGWRRELLELLGRYDVAVVRISAEKLDREFANEVKRNSPT